jgi:hypothetical protein
MLKLARDVFVLSFQPNIVTFINKKFSSKVRQHDAIIALPNISTMYFQPIEWANGF